ncbi:DUF3226 domain-containing protein [Bosea eneae]|uniref:DUF3226 domain-containing protein n=1 Tax=Bosea eneae TaxID=151454 RepID=A0ABW0IQA2_9HYPH
MRTLEDFVTYLVPAGDVLFPRVRETIDGLTEAERRFPPAHRTKAEIHTWLAWQAEPGTPMGLSIAKRYLNPEAAQVSTFLSWLERLFVPAM